MGLNRRLHRPTSEISMSLKRKIDVLTFLFEALSLFSRASRFSRVRLAGILTAGQSEEPSSSDTNSTTIFGAGLDGSGAGSGTPW